MFRALALIYITMSVAFSCCLVLPDSGADSGSGFIQKRKDGVYIVMGTHRMRISSVTSLCIAQRYIFALGASEELCVVADDKVPDPPCSSSIDARPVSVPTIVFVTDSGHSAIVEFSCRADKYKVLGMIRPGPVRWFGCEVEGVCGARRLSWRAPEWCGPRGTILLYEVELITQDGCRSEMIETDNICVDASVVAVRIRAADTDEILGEQACFVVS